MKEKRCGNCGNKKPLRMTCATVGKCDINYSDWQPIRENISFPILNNLTPTVESCTMKLIEELGELLQLIGKGKQASGEKIGMMPEEYMPQRMIEEAFDVAQSAVTMIHTIAEENNIDIEEWRGYHKEKLREKGYLK